MTNLRELNEVASNTTKNSTEFYSGLILKIKLSKSISDKLLSRKNKDNEQLYRWFDFTLSSNGTLVKEIEKLTNEILEKYNKAPANNSGDLTSKVKAHKDNSDDVELTIEFSTQHPATKKQINEVQEKLEKMVSYRVPISGVKKFYINIVKDTFFTCISKVVNPKQLRSLETLKTFIIHDFKLISAVSNSVESEPEYEIESHVNFLGFVAAFDSENPFGHHYGKNMTYFIEELEALFRKLLIKKFPEYSLNKTFIKVIKRSNALLELRLVLVIPSKNAKTASGLTRKFSSLDDQFNETMKNSIQNLRNEYRPMIKSITLIDPYTTTHPLNTSPD